MKKLLIILPVLLCLCGCGRSTQETVTLNVYNWGEYISDGSEGTVDVNDEFEKYCRSELGMNVKVNYTTYASNEDMYNKLRSGSATYDVVIPSDYMIEKMLSEGMLRELNFENIPNYKYVNESYRDLFYDKENKYSVPYTCGMVGIIYNDTMVEDKDTGSWNLLWNEKYKGKLLQFNNPRDAFGTAFYSEGIDVNTTDEGLWRNAAEKLKAQKPLVQSYVMDEIFNKMKNGSAAAAPYYAGDYLTMHDSNDSLQFYYPEEGTNVFVDAMCIPTIAKEPELAERYINFMLRDEIAIANAEYIAYASPLDNVRNNEAYIAYMTEWNENAMAILYPEDVDFKTTFFESLDNDTLKLQNSLWETLKIENKTEPWVHITSIAIVGVILLILLWNYIVKRIRDRY